jgi:hypothetical protein
LVITVLTAAAGCAATALHGPVAGATAAAHAATQPAHTPYLLGMRFPITPEGGYFPFFDRQLHGIHLTDAAGAKFVLGVPTIFEKDRGLRLMTWKRYEEDGIVLLDPGGPAEALVLDALRESLARGGPISYAPEWADGFDWEERQQLAHPLRHAEMQRRLAKDEDRKRQRDLLEIRLEVATAESRLKRATKDHNAQAADSSGNAWSTAVNELRTFYDETAKTYGLLGTAAPNGDGGSG